MDDLAIPMVADTPAGIMVKIFKKKVREDPVKYKCLANAARQEGPESSEDEGFICGA